MPAVALGCENGRFRTGRSASLPDCRAYELVTPEDLGRTQDLAFSSGVDYAAAAGGGDALALESPVEFGPEPSVLGVRAVFSRTPGGWKMKPLVEPGANEERFSFGTGGGLLSPDFSQAAFDWFTEKNLGEGSRNVTLDIGPVGGPYAEVPSVSAEEQPNPLGASANFSNVLMISKDHSLLGVPTGTDEHANDLYDWREGHLELVNVQGGPLVNRCGAELGDGLVTELRASATVNAVSQDGSKVFFTSPDNHAGEPSEPGCELPARLYMRVGGNETVEVSEPQGVTPPKVLPVRYNYATPDGSKVFFNTQTVLTVGETLEEQSENKLYEYDTEAPQGERLRLVVAGVSEAVGVKPNALIFSEDGSTVYEQRLPMIYRYDTSTGERTTVAVVEAARSADEPAYSTPDGEYYIFTSLGVEGEPRGQGRNGRRHNALYRYDRADGSVMCVSCGTGNAPEYGEVVYPIAPSGFEPGLGVTQISENGQEVFFQTTAQLVPQDTNSDEEPELGRYPGLDVYEWEADGAGGCELAVGCTYLLSAGEAVGPSAFLGASRDGSNVFFASAARLLPQATPEFHNIYDARVGGGFAPPPSPSECLSCQGVGSPPPLFNAPASGTFVGAGPMPERVVEERPKPEKPKKRHGKRRRGKPKATDDHVRSRRASRRGRRS